MSPVKARRFLPSCTVMLLSARDHLLIGLDADEGIAADVLAAFDRFEQEGFGLLGGDAEEGGDGRLEVGGDGSVDRDQRVLAAELEEVGGGGKASFGLVPWFAFIINWALSDSGASNQQCLRGASPVWGLRSAESRPILHGSG